MKIAVAHLMRSGVRRFVMPPNFCYLGLLVDFIDKITVSSDVVGI